MQARNETPISMLYLKVSQSMIDCLMVKRIVAKIMQKKKNGTNCSMTSHLGVDYGCALQKEILLQGRLYVSEQHICFNSNIFGWVTNVKRRF